MNTKDDAFLELTQQLSDDEKLRNSNQTLKGHETCERAIACSISPYNMLNPNEIRLIDILPGSHTDPIKVTLRTVNLAIIPRYEALSYVWDPKTGPSIFLRSLCLSFFKETTTSRALLRQI
jgi:hypothetical protein